MPNGIRVKQYRPSGPIKVVRSADSSSNSIVWKASKTSTMVSILQERELFFDCQNGIHGSADCFVYRLAGIYTYPDVSIGFLLYQYV